LHARDRALLSSIQAFYGVGNIISNKATNYVMYSVCSIKELEVILNHFDSYPLITQKLADYKLFKQVVLSPSEAGWGSPLGEGTPTFFSPLYISLGKKGGAKTKNI
jgi:hypothetical protein